MKMAYVIAVCQKNDINNVETFDVSLEKKYGINGLYRIFGSSKRKC